MAFRSFSLVDHKVAEADFFLDAIAEAGTNFFAAQCFVSAFTSAMRSITYAMQAVLADLPGFRDWYGRQQAQLRDDPICRFFHQFRRVNHHIGDNLVTGGSFSADTGTRYWFHATREVKEVPGTDVLDAYRTYFVRILALDPNRPSGAERKDEPK